MVSGLGELLGYGLRLVSGRFADATHQFWPITIAGYIIQMVSVPLLALAGDWPVAAVLIVLERVGKATRNPPRDAMLSHAATDIGYGTVFGIHEALDQFGAMLGPLAIAGILALRVGGYRFASPPWPSRPDLPDPGGGRPVRLPPAPGPRRQARRRADPRSAPDLLDLPGRAAQAGPVRTGR